MHLFLIFIALTLAYCLRRAWLTPAQSWVVRWHRVLFLFLFPPLLLIVTALTVVCMGPQGRMVGHWQGWQGWFSYGVAILFLGFVGVCGTKLAIAGWQTVQQIRSMPTINLHGKQTRLLETPALFSAKIGFWQSELVVSAGLLDLDEDCLQAILAHEQAHDYYRDTFWFFWLGWLRHCTAWLPQTEVLWQELLLLREMRADAWAATKVDNLLLAESLLLIVSEMPGQSEVFCAAFSATTQKNRLAERVDALLAPEPAPSIWWSWTWLLYAAIPLVALPFHT
jgi:hypothetical protein